MLMTPGAHGKSRVPRWSLRMLPTSLLTCTRDAVAAAPTVEM